MVLPRHTNISSDLMEELKSIGLDDAVAHEIAFITFLYHYSSNHDTPKQEYYIFAPQVSEPISMLNDFECASHEEISFVDAIDTINQQQEQYEKACFRIDALESKISQIQKTLQEAEREKNKLREQLKTAEESSRAEHEELISLRESLYTLSQTTEDPAPDESILLPHKTTRRIIVYGGHNSWRKQIREFLPEVTFIDKEMLPRPEAIKNADVIWIQPNALGHKHYYLVINTARTHNIPLRYFSYASARKCAEELVTDEVAI